MNIEQQIQEKGLTAPRITPEYLDSKIKKKEFHIFSDSCLTVCNLTLENGFNVTGESACASPENFNKEIGESIAYNNAREKLWPLLGYLLKQKLFEEPQGYEGRLLEEYAQLREKETKLSEFFDTTVFADLAPVDQKLLRQQHQYMHNYGEVLALRIDRL